MRVIRDIAITTALLTACFFGGAVIAAGLHSVGIDFQFGTALRLTEKLFPATTPGGDKP